MKVKNRRFNRPRIYSILGAICVFLFVMALPACDQQQLRDLEDVHQQVPQKAELYTNVDQYPNIVRICIDGVAFATLNRDYEPILRVPEWDQSFCNDDGATLQ